MCLKIDHQKRIDTNEDLRQKKKSLRNKQTSKNNSGDWGDGFPGCKITCTLIIEKETKRWVCFIKQGPGLFRSPVSVSVYGHPINYWKCIDTPHLHEGNNFQEFLSDQFRGSSSGREAASALTCGAVSPAWRFYCTVCLLVYLFFKFTYKVVDEKHFF